MVMDADRFVEMIYIYWFATAVAVLICSYKLATYFYYRRYQVPRNVILVRGRRSARES